MHVVGAKYASRQGQHVVRCSVFQVYLCSDPVLRRFPLEDIELLSELGQVERLGRSADLDVGAVASDDVDISLSNARPVNQR